MKSQIISIVFSIILAFGMVPLTQDVFAQNLLAIRQNVPFQLQINQTAYLESNEIKIQLLNVTGDSRCPSDVTCIWQGQVTVLVDISKGSQSVGNFTLIPSQNKTMASKTFDNYFIQVISVEPYPISTKRILPSDYAVNLKLSFLTPLKQYQTGISAKDVTCTSGFQLLIKAADGSPACVTQTTAKTLLARGWSK